MGYCEEILEDGDFCLDPASARMGYRCDRCFRAIGPIPMPYEITMIDRCGIRCWRIIFPGMRDRIYIIPMEDGGTLPYGFANTRNQFRAWTGHDPISYWAGIWEFRRH